MRSEPFLITGLPRSRTAWMTAAALNDQSLCVHEPLQHLARWELIFNTVWANSDVRYVGASDHALGFHLETIMKRLAPRTLIIDRPIADVMASGEKLGLVAPRFLEVLANRLTFDHPKIMRVPYAALSSSHVVKRCLMWLMPKADISLARLDALQALNIQADVARSIASGRSCKNLPALLGADVMAELSA